MQKIKIKKGKKETLKYLNVREQNKSQNTVLSIYKIDVF